MVTLVDVARQAGVSTATVSRVVNSPGVVDKTTRESVQQVINELGYRPNVVARGLVSQKSKTIGVVINQFSSSYYGRMLDGVESALTNVGYKAIAESSRETAAGELGAITSLLDRQCDGIVLHSDKLDDEALAELLNTHPQIVLMNRPLDGFEERCVYVDNVRGGELAASTLCAAGHEVIALVDGPANFFECVHRREGFRAELERRGLKFDDALLFHGDFTVRSGRAAMEKILESEIKPSAIFFLNDQMAAGALDFCIAHKISIPDEFSIIGFDDEVIAEFLHPKLTTIRQPLFEIGAAAGALAHAIATKSDVAAIKRVFDAEVLERASVKKLTQTKRSIS